MNVSKHAPKPFKREITNLTVITLGIFLYSLGFTVFVLPHHIVVGGMAGFSTLVFYATGGAIPVAATMYGVNLILLLSGWRMLGRGFVYRTIYGMTAISLMIGAMEGYFTTHPPIIASTPMSVGLGAVLMGLGIGLYYSHHGTCGGTDIVAAIMSRKTNLSMGRVMMIVDMTIVAASFFLPFDGSMEARVQTRVQTIIFGWLAIIIYSFIADKYVGAGHQTVQFIILSSHWDKIARRITHETGRGATIWDSTGYWTGASRKLMLVWCRQTDIYQIYTIVKEEDPGAYITASNVRSVMGNGFDELRIKKPSLW